MSNQTRRQFLTGAVGAGIAAAGFAPRPARAAGKIRIGFIPLTDCASVVMAHELGLYRKYGVDVEVTKEASWASVRDKLITGELQAAHCLFGMPFSVYTGVGGTPGKELKIAMVLNNNGQAITLANDLSAAGYLQYQKVPSALAALAKKEEVSFAMTFPGGTHDMWLRYWLAAAGVDQSKVKIITIPPPQMVANMKVGNMDGFSVGEPWGGVAVKQKIGFTHVTSQDIWKHHPEKALVCNPEFAASRRPELKNVMKAVLEASIWMDDMKNRDRAAKTIGGPGYVNAPADVIDARLMGDYDLGIAPGRHQYTDDTMLYHRGGKANFPYYGHAVWFMAQYVRFGYLKSLPDTLGIAKRLIMQDLYKEVAKEMKIAIPGDDMKPFTHILDKAKFDPRNPAAYLASAGGRK
jgi:nitrate/nitrite transport system substrate-binding protein